MGRPIFLIGTASYQESYKTFKRNNIIDSFDLKAKASSENHETDVYKCQLKNFKIRDKHIRAIENQEIMHIVGELTMQQNNLVVVVDEIDLYR